MKNNIKTFICVCLAAAGLFSTEKASGNTSPAEDKVIMVPDATFMYAERDTCELFMDVYNPVAGSVSTLR